MKEKVIMPLPRDNHIAKRLFWSTDENSLQVAQIKGLY